MTARHFQVSWTIDVFDAETPREAAAHAFARMQRPIDLADPDSPSVFDVEDMSGVGLGFPVLIDLSLPEGSE